MIANKTHSDVSYGHSDGLSDSHNNPLPIRSTRDCTLQHVVQLLATAEGVGMENFDNEDWLTLYQTAIVELERVKISGRIEAARTAIAARLRKLQNLPGLHPDERQAIADAYSGLRVLEDEQTRYDADMARAVDKALEKLHYIGPTMLKKREGQDNPAD